MHVFTRPRPSPLSQEHKAAHFVHTSAIQRGESPPLTSSLHSRNSARSAEESAYLRQAVVLKWVRLVFALFMSSVALSTVVVSSHLLRNYNYTVLPGEYNLSLWPLNTDVRPTLALLVPASLAITGGLLYIAFALAPSPHSRYLYQNYLFAFVSAGGSVASLIGISFSSYIEAHVSNSGRDSINSWTCGLVNGAKTFVADADSFGISVSIEPLVPEGFSLACVETQVAKWMIVGLIVIQVFSLVFAAVGLSSEKRMSRVRRSRFPDEKSSFA